MSILKSGMVRGRSPKLLEATGAAVFAAFGFLGSVNPAMEAFLTDLTDYGRSLPTLILAVVIFVLLPLVPFTEQYARETVPQQYWHSPVFRSVNRRISAGWGAVIAAMTGGHVLATVITETYAAPPGRPVDVLFNWMVPALLSWWAVGYTARVSADAHEAAATCTAHQAASRA